MKKPFSTSPVNLALADVGITALIDEATGYQYQRPQDELMKLFADCLDKRLAPWYRGFPSECGKTFFDC